MEQHARIPGQWGPDIVKDGKQRDVDSDFFALLARAGGLDLSYSVIQKPRPTTLRLSFSR